MINVAKIEQEIKTLKAVIKQLVKGELKKEKISIEELARNMGVCGSTLGFFLQGERGLSTASMVIVTNYFGISVDAIMGRNRGR